jgi:site-specific recombinase XerD
MDKNKIIEEYKAYLVASNKKLHGFKYSIKILNSYLEYSNYNFLSLSYKEAQEFQSYLQSQRDKYTPATVECIITPLSSMFNYLESRDLVHANPFVLIDRIKIPYRIPKNIPSEKTMDKLLKHLSNFTGGKNLCEYKRDYKLHILCELLYSTGIRINEAATIKLEDINFPNSSLLVKDSKTKTERRVFLNDYIKSILTIFIEEFRNKVLWFHNGGDRELLFGCNKNLSIWINSLLEEKCKEIDQDKITSHIFRHAFGYHLLKAGCDIRKIQSFLGHKRLATTEIYTQVDTEALRNVLDQYHPRQVKNI